MNNVLSTSALFSLIFALTLISAGSVIAATPASNVQKKADLSAAKTTFTDSMKALKDTKKTTDKATFKQSAKDLRTTYKTNRKTIMETFKAAKALENTNGTDTDTDTDTDTTTDTTN